MAICQQPKQLPPSSSRRGLDTAKALARAWQIYRKSRLAFMRSNRRRLKRIASDLVELPRSISDPQLNQQQTRKNYENQNLSRRQCLRRKSCFLHAPWRANDAHDIDFTRRFARGNGIPSRPTDRASTSISWEGFGGRSKCENVYRRRQTGVACLQNHRRHRYNQGWRSCHHD